MTKKEEIVLFFFSIELLVVQLFS